MATAIVMNLAGAPSTAQSTSKGAVSKSAGKSANSRGDSFDSALKSAQEGESQKVPRDIKDVAKEVAQDDGVNKFSEKSSATTEKDSAPTEQPQETKTTDDAPKATQDAGEQSGQASITSITAAQLLSTLFAGTNADLLNADEPDFTETPNVNLQTILPQNDDAAKQNRQMLNRLSGGFMVHEVADDVVESALNADETVDGEQNLPTANAPRDILSLQTQTMAQNVAKVLDATPQENVTAPQADELMAQMPTAKQEAPNVADKIFMPTEDVKVAADVPQILQNLRNFPQMPETVTPQEPVTNLNVNIGANVEMSETVRQTMPQANGEAQVSVNDASELLNDAKMSIEDAMNPFDGLMREMSDGKQNNAESGQGQAQPDIPANVIEQMRTQGENAFVKEMAERQPSESNAAPTNTNHTGAATPSVPTQSASVENNANVQEPQNPQNVRDNYNVREQIVEQARMIRSQESTEMVIRLRPEHLGELTLRVSVTSNGAVNASFHTPNAEVRAIIENSLVQLKQELNNQGLKVEDVEVYAGLADGQLPGRDGQAWQQGRGQNAETGGRNTKLDAENFEETNDAITPTTANGDLTEGVDYRV